MVKEIRYLKVPEFDKDLKDLRKRYPSIDDDLKVFQTALSIDPEHLTGIFEIDGLKKKGIILSVYKAKKFACQSLNRGNKSGMRVIYAYDKTNNVVFLNEIYFKGNQTNHDEQRIIRRFKGITSEDVKKIVKDNFKEKQLNIGIE